MTALQVIDPHGEVVAAVTAPKLCECGCGERAPLAKKTRNDIGHVKGEPIRFCNGHQGKGRPVKVFQIDSDGRAYVRTRNGRRYIWPRVLMWNEIGRELGADEIVHHVNEDCADDRVENYQIVSRAEHIELHRKSLYPEGKMASIRTRVARACATCGAPIEVTPGALKEKNYCSTACSGLGRRGRVDALTCGHCGDAFYCPPSSRQGRRTYCSQACAHAAQRAMAA